MNETKPSWSLKLLLSSSLAISGAAIVPFQLDSSGIQSTVAEAASTYTTTANLNLRLSAATWSPVLLTIPSGSSVTYISTYGSWYKVSYGGKTGYVASQYVSVSNTSAYYKTTDRLNMRLTAASWSDVVTVIPADATVKYVSRYGSWYKVTFNGKTGYVASAYLTPTSAPVPPSDYYKTTANLNLRLSAASWSDVLTVIPAGSVVKYVSRYDSWYKVTYNGKTGYVASEYLKPTTVTTPTDTNGTGKTVVIDAGHGGNDPGAVYGSVYEKVIALDIAKRLAGILSSTYDYNVKLTRSNDTYLSLEQRVSLNKSYKGDVFVSLHANSSVYNTAHGHEVLVPTSESYTTNPYVSASRSLGSSINKEIASRISTIQNRGVKYQNVYVVGRNVSPSTLVEYGFISNSSDRSYLTNTTYRQRMAEATASGIHQFMRSYY
ncbi:N-acetylmuramoyl-L-alanine amidase [Exiguobacterium sp. PFWT01]|uniref:N-acetylmuramoyl-L-alanine amidase n=1 Tax=Exiguobacterium sp. PFWT01 TaxID=2829816 RepID=UPI001BA5A5FE|nr:N-acetylmuramoyl-L-alanine amidase [Exiguobacterium sp. PFWT01]QUP86749.1 N-acetylmuramoyl-L-alanine amidase [Exiguobacterium sp. PFWT01]